MILIKLRCQENHYFESWFASNDAFDTLLASDYVHCPECGTNQISRALMAPQIQTSRKKAKPPAEVPMMTKEEKKLRTKIQEIHQHLKKNGVDVGTKFAQEARKIHLGDRPEELIYGEASKDEIQSLIEDEIPILPIPSSPRDS